MDRLFLETKLLADDAGALSGIAWPFGSPDRVGDVIEKGAFAGAVLPLPMLFGHDQNDPIGVWEKAEEKADGLHVKGRLLIEDVPRAREVRALVQAGAVRGLSIGFTGRKALPRKGGGRTITQLDLLEVSLVTVPAHPGAQVTSAKSAVDALRIVTALHRAIVGDGDFGVTIQESDTTTSGDFADAAAAVIDTDAPATLAASASYRLGYRGFKRYVRLSLTKAGGTSIAAGAVAVIEPLTRPVP